MRTEMPIMIDWLVRRKHPDWPKSIPMSLLNEEWSDRNHSQTLNRLAERGGLAPCEALAIMDKRRWQQMDESAAIDELVRRLPE